MGERKGIPWSDATGVPARGNAGLRPAIGRGAGLRGLRLMLCAAPWRDRARYGAKAETGWVDEVAGPTERLFVVTSMTIATPMDAAEIQKNGL